MLSDVLVNGVVTTITSTNEYDVDDVRIIRYSDVGLEWTKVVFKTQSIAILAAPSLSGIKWAVNMPDNHGIVFTGRFYN